MFFLTDRLAQAQAQGLLRTLPQWSETALCIDFCSNDYLGLARRGFATHGALLSGATGSRLISGNRVLMEKTEAEIALFHKAEAALLFNSGYEANMGLIGALAKRGAFFLYDAQIHRSIREALKGSEAWAFSFQHQQIQDLKRKLAHIQEKTTGNKSIAPIFVIIESVYSMNGSVSQVREILSLCQEYQAHLIVDEAHATGLMGDDGAGLVQSLNVQDRVFARVHTFGKALGLMGAAVVGSALLKKYLINFSPAFIYTTAMPPLIVAAIREAYRLLPGLNQERAQLFRLIEFFRHHTKQCKLSILPSATPIQAILCPGNDAVQQLAKALQNQQISVQAIRSPTVMKGTERLRISLHTFNTEEEIIYLVQEMKQFS